MQYKKLLRTVHGQGICFTGTGVDGCGGRDDQTQRIALFCGIAEAVGGQAIWLMFLIDFLRIFLILLKHIIVSV